MLIKYFLIAMLLFWACLLELNSQTPLTVDAGASTNYCLNINDTVVFGGNPTASGGIMPYKYDWVIYSKTTGKVYSVLNDKNENHAANPKITADNINDSVILKVTVTDSISSIVSDSCTLGISCIKFKHLKACYRILLIDSVLLGTCNVYLGIKPYTYHWSPSEGLSNPFIEKPLAKPDSTTFYTVEVTDKIGCSTEDEMPV